MSLTADATLQFFIKLSSQLIQSVIESVHTRTSLEFLQELVYKNYPLHKGFLPTSRIKVTYCHTECLADSLQCFSL